MPTEAAPEATAAKAYSICTNLPEGLRTTDENVINSARSEDTLRIGGRGLPEGGQRERVSLGSHDSRTRMDSAELNSVSVLLRGLEEERE